MSTMRVQKIQSYCDKPVTITPKEIMKDFIGEQIININHQHFGDMLVESWTVLLSVDKFLYLSKIPEDKLSVFQKSKEFFKTPQTDVKSALELMEL